MNKYEIIAVDIREDILKGIYKPNEKLNILKLRKIENNSFINYIYRYNIVKIHNNNIKLKKSSDYLTFMTKKSEQYANDIRAYKRSK